MNIGFTGTQIGPTSRRQVCTVIELLSSLRDRPLIFHHGCCVGWDDKAARIARLLGYQLIGYPPLNNSRLCRVINDWDYDPQPYLVRNHHIVDSADLLIAVPRLDHEELRSGTWATIRYAARIGKPGLVVWPDGNLNYLKEPVYNHGD